MESGLAPSVHLCLCAALPRAVSTLSCWTSTGVWTWIHHVAVRNYEFKWFKPNGLLMKINPAFWSQGGWEWTKGEERGGKRTAEPSEACWVGAARAWLHASPGLSFCVSLMAQEQREPCCWEISLKAAIEHFCQTSSFTSSLAQKHSILVA